jgi:hypothetical protein
VTSDRWNKDTGQCKQYIANADGIALLNSRLGIGNSDNQTVLPVVQQQYAQELTTGDFVYQDKSSRLWHPLQNFRRDTKQNILEQSGYGYHYDIENCAMTLIYQHSQQIPELVQAGRWLQGPMDLYLPAMTTYLRDRQSVRNQIAQEADLDPDVVKRIITALLAGAKLSRHTNGHIYQMLDGDLARIEFLQQHPFLCDLRADIRTCWEYIKPTLPRRSRVQIMGRERMLPISSKQKWGVYFDLERQVLNEIRVFLKETHNRHFLEHDGWSCEREIDTESLRARVLERTGFSIEIDCK